MHTCTHAHARTHARTHTHTHTHTQGNKITRILQVYIRAIAVKTYAVPGYQNGCYNWKDSHHQRTQKEAFASLNTMLVSRIVCPSTIYGFFGICKRYFMCEV